MPWFITDVTGIRSVVLKKILQKEKSKRFHVKQKFMILWDFEFLVLYYDFMYGFYV